MAGAEAEDEDDRRCEVAARDATDFR